MSSSEEYRTKCPFCSVQDDIIIKRGNPNSALFGRENLFQLYVDVKSDRGLCPRGNFVIELITSPYRLRKVMVNGKVEDLSDAIKECSTKLKKIAEKRNEVVILIGGNHTLEEAYLAKELAEKLNTELIGLFPFEDEALLSIKNDFSFNEISSSDTIFTVGDIFSHSPTLSKLIIDARNKERGNSLLYLDIIGGRISPFAKSYIIRPGYTAYFLSILLDYINNNKRKIELEKTRIDVPYNSIEEIASTLNKSKNGWILFSNLYGHFKNPFSIVSLLMEIANRTDNHFASLPVAQNSLGVGRVIGEFNNEKIIKGIKNKKIKGLISFGGLPTEFIPGFDDFKKNISFILSSSILRKDDFTGYLFPSTLSVEKQGSIISLEEEIVTLGKSLSPVPGAISDGVLISKLIKGVTGQAVKAYVGKVEPIEGKSIGKVSIPISEVDEEYPFTLIGVGLPYHHGSGELTRMTNWNKERGGPYLFLNPSQYKEMGFGNKIKIVTPYSSSLLSVGNLSESPYEIPEGVVIVPTHYTECMKLFPLEVDSDHILSPGAVKARLEQ